MLTKLPQAQDGYRDVIHLFICPVEPERSRVWFRLAVTDFDSPDDELRAFQHTIFTQDQPVLESQRPRRLPLSGLELHSAADRLSTAYRRYLREQGESLARIGDEPRRRVLAAPRRIFLFQTFLWVWAALILAVVNARASFSLGVSVGLAAVFTILRLLQKSPPSAAIGGLVAAGAAAALALFTGRGQDNFVPGLITNAAYGTVLLVTTLIGWSLIGLAVGFLMGEATAWRQDRRKRRAFFWLGIAWSALLTSDATATPSEARHAAPSTSVTIAAGSVRA